MKLRVQLVLLVGGAAVLFLASVAAYFIILSPVDAMQKEALVFQEVDRAASNLLVQGNLLASEPLGPQTKNFEAAKERWLKSLESVASVVYLPQVSEEMFKAINSVQKLGVLTEEGIKGVDASIVAINEALDGTGITTGSNGVMQLTKTSLSGDMEQSSSLVLQFNLYSLLNKLQTLNNTLTTTQTLIQKKDEFIQQGLAQVKATSSFVGLAAILLAVALAVGVSYLLARNITKAMQALGATVARVGTGDLRVRLRSRRKDEIGGLGRDIDSFLETLTASFRRIQDASAANLEVKDQLVSSVSSATSSAIQIEANSSSILAQLQKADERIQGSEADLNGVVVLLEAFHTRLEAQGQEVADSNRAVTELAQGISRISSLSTENRHAVEALLAESDRGREVFDRSFAKVAEINDSVATIQDMVGAIADIASQTNILALNAAIEAAHAGEAGKGFAVVSDEISKLAAASAASSAQIAETIKDVVGKIREAGATRVETLSAFDAIGTHIAKVSHQGRDIDSEADHMNQETHRIREVMESLSSKAEATTQEADRIGTVANNLGDALGQVGRISHEVVSNIGEITSGLAEISRTVGEVQEQADRLGRVGSDLDDAVNAFQTEEDLG